jgi:hypothetical protein
MIQVGDRFNLLVAVRREGRDRHGHTQWVFKCDCGNERIITVAHVKAGHAKSCGCFRNSTGLPPVIQGAKFGHWTAIREIGWDEGKNNKKWLFRCDCGTERVRHAASAKYRGGAQSCGCTRKPTIDKLRIDLIFKTIRRGSVKRGIPFAITKSDIRRLAEAQGWKCVRTGISLDLTTNVGSKRPFGPTIDRIDNERGYEPDNIQLVCNLYNFCKNEFTDEDVLTFASALVEHSLSTNQIKRAA